MVKLRRRGGRRLGAARPERAAPGLLSPGPLFCLAAEGRPCGPPLGRQTPPPPRVTQRFPSPLGQRASAGITAVAHGKQESRGGHAGGGAERRQWRKKRGGSPVSKGVEGSRFSGDAQRPLRTAGPLPGKARQRARSGAEPRCAAAPAGRWEHVPAMGSIRQPFPPHIPSRKAHPQGPNRAGRAAALGMGIKPAK